jgi:hypothetical protein
MTTRIALASLAMATLAMRATAQSSGIVLQLPASARAAALGNAYVASPDGDASLFYNPALLAADARRISASFSVQRYVEGSNAGALSVATGVGFGRAAIGLQMLDFGSENEIVPDPDYGGERGMETGRSVGARELAATAAYAIRIARFHGGVAVKLINQQVADLTGSTGALDIGGAVTVRGGTLAIVMQNSGGVVRVGQTTAPLPLAYRGGFESRAVALGRARLSGVAELSKFRDGDLAWAAGSELWMRTSRGLQVSGRAGWRAKHYGGAGLPLTLGGGISGSRLALDYAYHTVEGLEIGTHRVGVRWGR